MEEIQLQTQEEQTQEKQTQQLQYQQLQYQLLQTQLLQTQEELNFLLGLGTEFLYNQRYSQLKIQEEMIFLQLRMLKLLKLQKNKFVVSANSAFTTFCRK